MVVSFPDGCLVVSRWWLPTGSSFHRKVLIHCALFDGCFRFRAAKGAGWAANGMISERIPRRAAGQAHELLEQRPVIGKLLLLPGCGRTDGHVRKGRPGPVSVGPSSVTGQRTQPRKGRA